MAKETIGLKIETDTTSVRRATRDLDGMASASSKMSKGIGLGVAAVAALGAAAVAAGTALVAFTMSIAEQADAAAKNARALGLTSDAYQELDFALKISGTSMEGSAGAFRRLAANAADAQAGLGEAVSAFDSIGVSATDASGELRPMEDLIADISDEFRSMENHTRRAALAQDFFGRSGAQMTTFLLEGADGIAALREEARQYGIVISGDAAEASEELNDDILRLKTAATGFAQGLAVELIPRIREVVGQLVELISSAKTSNADVSSLASGGLELMISAFRGTALAAVRLTQGMLFLKRSWIDFGNTVAEVSENLSTGNLEHPIQRMGRAWLQTVGLMEETAPTVGIMDPAIAAIDDVVADLEVLAGSISMVGSAADDAGRSAEDFVDAIRQFMGITDDVDPEPFRPTQRSAEEATLSLVWLTDGLARLSAAHEYAQFVSGKFAAALQIQIDLKKEMNALDAARTDEKKSGLMESLREQARLLKEISIAAADQATGDALDLQASKWEQLGKLGSAALGGIMSGIGSLSLAAFWEKDGDALKEFGKSLGKMLIQLGTMAIAYAAVAALGTLFPALAPLVGSPAAAPALAIAGAGAIAAGAILGAAIPRGGRGKAEDPTPSGGGGPTTQQNIYNVTFDSLTPARARNRAMVEGIGSSIESAA
tara:strand:- start:81 stop:2060 length:1980 start_codon:yes stop_codon:yes gene_type:complete